MGEVIMKQPNGNYSVTDSSNMLGGDYHRTINASDGTIPEEDIKRYYDIAMKLDWQDGWYSSEQMKKAGHEGPAFHRWVFNTSFALLAKRGQELEQV